VEAGAQCCGGLSVCVALLVLVSWPEPLVPVVLRFCEGLSEQAGPLVRACLA
jgi:hypothetical protein